MYTAYVSDKTHTLSSALRHVLETNCPDQFVACCKMHPLDTFVRIDAPRESDVRNALLELKDQIAAIRASVRSK